MYADLGARGDGKEFHLNFTAADNFVGVAAGSPIELLDQAWSKVFTVPQTTRNIMDMVSASGTVAVSDAVKLSGVAYYRYFNQQHVDANISSARDCGGLGVGAPGFLCLVNVDGSTIPLVDQYGKVIPTPHGVVGDSTALRSTPKASAARCRRPISRSCSGTPISSSSAPVSTMAG